MYITNINYVIINMVFSWNRSPDFILGEDIKIIKGRLQ